MTTTAVTFSHMKTEGAFFWCFYHINGSKLVPSGAELFYADLLYLTTTSADEIHDGMNLELYYQ